MSKGNLPSQIYQPMINNHFRICIFSPFPMFPDTAGNRIRLKVLCQDLKASGFEIHFVYHPREDGGKYQAEDLDQHKTIADQIFVLPYLGTYDELRPKGQVESDIWDPSIEPFAKSLFQNIHYDAVIVNYAPFARFLTFAPYGCQKIIDTHDRLSGRLQLLEKNGQKPSFYYMDDSEEGRLLAHADLILAIKEQDAAHFHNVSRGVPVLTVGMNPVSTWDGKEVKKREFDPNRISAGFIGSTNSVNLKAVRSLFKALVELKDTCPSLEEIFTLNIYGSICNELIQTELPECVILKGFIDDPINFYDDVDLVLIPTVESTGLKIKAVEALKSQRSILATADGFSGIDSPYSHHNFESVFALTEHLLQILNQDPKSRLSSFRNLKNTTDLVFESYCKTYDNSLSTLIKSINKPDARLFLEWRADAQGWIKTLVILRAALPILSAQFKLFINDPPNDPELHLRLNQIQDLNKALSNHQIIISDDKKYPNTLFSIAADVNPAGILSISDFGAEKQGQDIESKTHLTGFAINNHGKVNSWVPWCNYTNNYWGKNCELIVLLDGVPQARGASIISHYLTYLAQTSIKIKIEFIASESSLAAYELAGLAVSSVDSFLSRPRKKAFLGIIDLGEDGALSDRTYIIYTLNRSFYIVNSLWKRERISSLRGPHASVFLEYEPLNCLFVALKSALCEETFQKMYTYFNPNPISSSLLKNLKD